MEFLKSLTRKQWLIIFCITAFFVAGYFFFFRKNSEDKTADELNRLMTQGTAPVPSEAERLNKLELEKLMKQTTAPVSSSPSSGLPKKTLTEEEKAALLKLMSAPKPQ